MSTAVRLHRDLPAPPEKVYRAWLDPDLLRRWLAPGGLEVARADVGGFDCELVELEQDRRIVWRWGFVGPQRTEGPTTFDSLLTVTLDGKPDGRTALTLVHERLEDLAAAMPQVADGVAPGWKSVLDKLAEVAA